MDVSKTNTKLDLTSINTAQTKKNEQGSINTEELQQNQQDEEQEDLNNKLQDIVEKLNEQMLSLETNVKFGYNDKVDSMYVSVIEKNTGREIRRIPSHEAMRLTQYFKDVIGMIFDKES